jgi:hypothetical protein
MENLDTHEMNTMRARFDGRYISSISSRARMIGTGPGSIVGRNGPVSAPRLHSFAKGE